MPGRKGYHWFVRQGRYPDLEQTLNPLSRFLYGGWASLWRVPKWNFKRGNSPRYISFGKDVPRRHPVSKNHHYRYKGYHFRINSNSDFRLLNPMEPR